MTVSVLLFLTESSIPLVKDGSSTGSLPAVSIIVGISS